MPEQGNFSTFEEMLKIVGHHALEDNLFHFHVKLNTFRINLATCVSTLHAFEIKLNILQIKMRVYLIKLEALQDCQNNFCPKKV